MASKVNVNMDEFSRNDKTSYLARQEYNEVGWKLNACGTCDLMLREKNRNKIGERPGARYSLRSLRKFDYFHALGS